MAEAAEAEPVLTTTNAQEITELAKQYWAQVTANPDDFETWGKLIRELEGMTDISHARKALSLFLADYPLCFGYWKRWASKERKAGNREEAFALLEKGVQATPYSHQLWTHYCDQLRAPKSGYPVSAVRSLLQRAAGIIGLDYNSEAFWAKYLAFEQEQGDIPTILRLYRDIISTPFKELDSQWLAFQAHAATVPVAALKAVLADDGGDGEAKDGEAAEGAETGEDSAEARAAVMKRFEQLYSKASRIQKKMSHYEYDIQRPYYHVKPLDPEDLANWKAYVAWAETQLLPEKEGKAPLLTMKEVVTIFERCMVTCANYPNLWIAYADFMEKHDVAEARRIHERATSVFVKRNPSAFLAFAQFEERHGNAEHARKLYTRLVEMCPTDLESVLSLASFERRHHGNVCVVYDAALKAMGDNAECVCFICLHYVRYLITGGLADARARAETLFERALEVAENTTVVTPSLKKSLFIVWMAYINFASTHPGNVEATVVKLYERAVSPQAKVPLTQEALSTVWRHYVVFMEDRARHLPSIEDVRRRFKETFPKKATRKRKADGSGNDAKQARTAETKGEQAEAQAQAQDQVQQAQQVQQVQQTPADQTMDASMAAMDPNTAAYYQYQYQQYQQYGYPQYAQQY